MVKKSININGKNEKVKKHNTETIVNLNKNHMDKFNEEYHIHAYNYYESGNEEKRRKAMVWFSENVDLIDNEDMLGEIVLESKNKSAVLKAIKRISNLSILYNVGMSDDVELALAAVDRLAELRKHGWILGIVFHTSNVDIIDGIANKLMEDRANLFIPHIVDIVLNKDTFNRTKSGSELVVWASGVLEKKGIDPYNDHIASSALFEYRIEQDEKV